MRLRARWSERWSEQRFFFFRSATGGADSGPASLEGTPTDDKNGQQAFGAGKSRCIDADDSFDAKINDCANRSSYHLHCSIIKMVYVIYFTGPSRDMYHFKRVDVDAAHVNVNYCTPALVTAPEVSSRSLLIVAPVR